MAEDTNILKPGKNIDELTIRQLVDSPDPINPRDWVKALGLLGPQKNFLDDLASSVGFETETMAKGRQAALLQAPALKMLEKINEAKAARMTGPTQGQVLSADPVLASRIGVQSGMVAPGIPQEAPGFEERAVPAVKGDPNAVLNPAQRDLYASEIHRRSLSTQQPSEAVVGQANVNELTQLEAKRIQGTLTDPLDIARYNVLGGKGKLFEAGARPGTPEGEGAVIKNELDRAKIQHVTQETRGLQQRNDQYPFQSWLDNMTKLQKFEDEAVKNPIELENLRKQGAHLDAQTKEIGERIKLMPIQEKRLAIVEALNARKDLQERGAILWTMLKNADNLGLDSDTKKRMTEVLMSIGGGELKLADSTMAEFMDFLTGRSSEFSYPPIQRPSPGTKPSGGLPKDLPNPGEYREGTVIQGPAGKFRKQRNQWVPEK